MSSPPPQCSFPSSPLLAFLLRLQSAALQALGHDSFDPKHYVDLPLKHDLLVAASAFENLPRTGPNGSIPRSELEEFIQSYFDDAGDDLVCADPPDFENVPEGFLPGVEMEEVRAWALEVHGLWRKLCRRVSNSVRERPERHTLLPLPDQVVVPGARFREVYYWDSYWNIREHSHPELQGIVDDVLDGMLRGLLASKMHNSARAVVNNLLSLVDNYGFVLNGTRTYYANRSQPPLLSSMAMEIYLKTCDFSIVKRALPALLKEHHFWNSGNHVLIIEDAQGCTHSLSRYYAMWSKPRPESATIDENSALKLHNNSNKDLFYRELASAAESGWDFSSRWMSDVSGKDLTTMSTTSILPVDLNAFILKMELDISFFASVVGDTTLAFQFKEAAKLRTAAIDSIFWNAELGQWLDYWVQLRDGLIHNGVHMWDCRNQNRRVFASNFVPIWFETYHSDSSRVQKVMTSLKSSGLLCRAGVATSLTNSGEQWDFPNGWAPLQHMIVEGLTKSAVDEAKSLAEDIALRWIRTNFAAYKRTGAMHEKYNVDACGEAGGGGEYKPQTGFGWSNGVILAFLEEFGWPKDRELNW